MAGSRRRLFISSVQKELQEERRAIKNFVQGDALMRRYFDVFLFEDLPAKDRRADQVYLEEVERCAVYVGVFGNEYGHEGSDGLSPTEREFNHATALGKPRLIFVKGANDEARHPKMLKLVRRAGSQLIRRRFHNIPELTSLLYASLVDYLEKCGELHGLPFDAAACPRAAIADISTEKLRWFLARAREERNYPLPEGTSIEKTLMHLNLLDGQHPSHAALLLFGKDPQRFLPSAEVKCAHFHGTEVEKPMPSYQIYRGTIFDQVDQAVDFVMTKLARSVGTRSGGPEASVGYEVPRDVVSEAIVNAVAHRDYTSNAGVQVMLFADRLEIWNPGELPPGLTPEKLREPHASIPRNPLIAEPLYLAHYIEKVGTGTLDMISRCRESGLSEPDFEQRSDQFVVTIWRDWLTDKLMIDMGLNDRMKKALAYLKMHGRITNSEYRRITGVSRATATRDLVMLLNQGIFEKIGTTGKGTYYVLTKKRITNDSKDS